MRPTNYIYICLSDSYENHDGVICLGYRHTEDKSIIATGSFCSPKDKFSRKKAHLIIEGRFDNNKCVRIETEESNIKYKDAINIIVNHFVKYIARWEFELNKNIPHWVLSNIETYIKN